ncbi:hypothetical protein [Novosphingopyxis sp.]|uniref:hypothetical protein n=1 Tax=Novosphingopyxis sp. TaxID=2709690 RepID=UPI003B5C30CC
MRHEAQLHYGLSRGAGRFVRQILDLAGPDWVVERAGERPWASVTFEGMRVRATLRSGGRGAACSLCQLCATIEQADYGVHRYLVADVAARDDGGKLGIEALLIERA